MALLCVDKFTPHDANPPSTITTTNCATRRMPQTAIRRAPTTPIWHFYEKMAPKARNQPLRSHEQRNHRRHRPPTFISTIPVMVPPRGFGHRRRLRPPYQPIPQTEKVCGLRFSTRKGLGGQPPRGYVVALLRLLDYAGGEFWYVPVAILAILLNDYTKTQYLKRHIYLTIYQNSLSNKINLNTGT